LFEMAAERPRPPSMTQRSTVPSVIVSVRTGRVNRISRPPAFVPVPAEVISHRGPRPEADVKALAAKVL
jgi:hypothetical protein